MPLAILNVRGIPIIVKKAGRACRRSFQSMRPTDSISMDPTIINAGAVATAGTAEANFKWGHPTVPQNTTLS